MNVWTSLATLKGVARRYELNYLPLGGRGDLCLSLTSTYHECPRISLDACKKAVFRMPDGFHESRGRNKLSLRHPNSQELPELEMRKKTTGDGIGINRTRASGGMVTGAVNCPRIFPRIFPEFSQRHRNSPGKLLPVPEFS
jgi:hypothetical protein